MPEPNPLLLSASFADKFKFDFLAFYLLKKFLVGAFLFRCSSLYIFLKVSTFVFYVAGFSLVVVTLDEFSSSLLVEQFD